MSYAPSNSMNCLGRYLPTVGLIVACAAQAPAGCPVKNVQRPHAAERGGAGHETTTARVIVTPTEAFSINELYAHAVHLAAEGQWALAAREFDRVYELDRDGPLAAAACYHAGVAYDQSAAERESQELALDRFRTVLSQFSEERWAAFASLRALRLAVHLELWAPADELASSFEHLTPHPSPAERSLVSAAHAMHGIALGQLEVAQRFVEDGLATVEENRIDTIGQLPRDVAALYFALGELKRVEADRIRFVPPPADFAAVLEARCQLLLDAQRAYADSMRAYDAHWSSMAGVRTSELYVSLHRDLMQVPPPATAKPGASATLFNGAMRLRYSVLLEKALAMLDHTLQMTERTGERSAWALRAAAARADILEAKRLEDEAIAALPYTRQELRRALDLLRQSDASDRRGR